MTWSPSLAAKSPAPPAFRKTAVEATFRCTEAFGGFANQVHPDVDL
jgi:hypothetical protein